MTAKVVFNQRELDKLVKEKIAPNILERCQRIAARANQNAGLADGYEASVVIGRRRAHGSVIANDRRGRLAEARSRALTTAIEAGRGD